MNKSIFILLLCVSFLALGGIFVKLSPLDPINTAFYRVLFALPIFYFLCIFKENKFKKYKNKLSGKKKLLCLLSGVFLSLDLVLWNISFSYTTVVNANLLSNLVALTVVPFSYFLFKEKPMNSFYLSAPIMIIGVFMLFSEKNQLGSNHFFWKLFGVCNFLFLWSFFIDDIQATQ
ncbi:EamA family transporter [Moraxella marmotae]|uniref:EamA family transporter n=1 Tax=Moraxella marmotae TaxID=3344520 RepID=UPI0035F3C45F